jgi:hypothetical protein
MVAPAILGMVLEGARTVLDRVLPDEKARAAAELELLRLQQAGGLAQLEVNKAEAASGSLFVAGWRPYIGWACGFALSVQYVFGPMVQWGAAIAGHPLPEMPRFDDMLWELIALILGAQSLRTFEKIKGKA